MITRRQALYFGLAALTVTACDQTVNQDSSNQDPSQIEPEPLVLNGAGATFPAAIYLRWFAAYNQINPQVQINYQPVGSAAGEQQFINQTVDFAASDTGLAAPGLANTPAIAIPMTAGAIVLGYNLPGVTELKLPRQVYADIYLGKITTWNDPAIAAANPSQNLPNLPIALVYRSDGSGTTEIFTRHLSAISPTWKTQVGSGKTVQWPAGTGTKGNEGITAQILQAPGVIGYIEFAYAKLNKISGALLENQKGNYIPPSLEATAIAINDITLDQNLTGFALDPANPQAYPIASYSWILLYKKYNDPAKANTLKQVLNWALTEGQKLSPAQGYVQLTAPVVAQSQQALAQLG
ncbi:MAG: phosphate ABC transporter substrate-binding protein PstS [Pseudanabaenaceae cyanobacterium bins.68]|nr:phosphate ABC transporter substrate-binding protein PstS [Pseudanabaenaceae cyanobacterium bins.68]